MRVNWLVIYFVICWPDAFNLPVMPWVYGFPDFFFLPFSRPKAPEEQMVSHLAVWLS